MRHWPWIKKVMGAILICLILFQITGCGYIFWPERRGQSHTEHIDPAVLILDALGLLCFIIPGVVALIVDISSHTIYLPHG